MARAAGGTSQRLKLASAMVLSRDRNPIGAVFEIAMVIDFLLSLFA
jgi:hypothetical protein